MKSIRLLPVVIFAALALLVFKGIGLVTNGGYVLSGPTVVMAQEADEAGLLSAPSEAMMTDSSPTLADAQPTLPAKVDAPPDGAPSAPSSEPSGPANTGKTASVCPEAAPSASAPPAEHDITDKIGNALANGCPQPNIPVNAHGDVLPSTKDGRGKIVPLETAEGDESGPALLQRLSERRAELDKREADLAMREIAGGGGRDEARRAHQAARRFAVAGRGTGRPEAGGGRRQLQGHRVDVRDHEAQGRGENLRYARSRRPAEGGAGP